MKYKHAHVLKTIRDLTPMTKVKGKYGGDFARVIRV